MRPWIQLLVISALSFARLGPASAAESAPRQQAPTHTLEAIAEELDKYSRSILESQSFYIEYSVVDSQTFTPSKYGTHEAGFDFRLGRKGDLWYAWLKGSSQPLRFKHDMTCVFRDGIYARLLGRSLLVDAKPESYLYMWWDYTDNLGVNAYKYLPQSAREDTRPEFAQPFLPEVIRAAPGEYRVAPTLEEMDGAWCHLVERPGVDRVWLDGERGFAVLRRELYCGGDVPPQTLRRVYSNSEFVKAKEGVWLPKTQVVDWYPDPQTEAREIWGKLACRTTMKAAKIEFDTLDDEFFAVEVPSGTYVNDFVRNVEYVAQADSEPPFSPALRFLEGKRLQSRGVPWLVIANVAVIVLLVGVVLVRMLRRPQAARRHA